jgi:hypothetical protein
LKFINRGERDTGPEKRRFNTTMVEHLDFSVEGIPEKFASGDEPEQFVVEAVRKLIDSLTLHNKPQSPATHQIAPFFCPRNLKR